MYVCMGEETTHSQEVCFYTYAYWPSLRKMFSLHPPAFLLSNLNLAISGGLFVSSSPSLVTINEEHLFMYLWAVTASLEYLCEV